MTAPTTPTTPTGSSTGDWEFAVPPTWPAPPGFDPRKGHVVDPTWPAPPADWQFWVRPGTAPRPAQLGSTVLPGAPHDHAVTAQPKVRRGYRVSWWRIAMGVGIALLVMRAIAGFGSGSSGGDGVGSCWAPKGGTTYTSVPCGSSGAQYRVVATVADPASCPDTSNSYLDTRMVGSGTRYECLAPLR